MDLLVLFLSPLIEVYTKSLLGIKNYPQRIVFSNELNSDSVYT